MAVMTQGVFGLPDAAFFEGKAQQESDRVADRVLEDNDFMGLLLDGPARAEIDQRNQLPLAGVRKCTHEQNFDVNLDARAILVAARLETGEVSAGRAFEVKDAGAAERPKRPAKFPKGRSVQPFSIDARSRLPDLSWRPGTLALTLLLWDQRSNTVFTRLEHRATRDPEVQKYLDALRRPRFPGPASPAEEGEVSYDQGAASPPLPAGVGLDLAVARVVVAGRGAKAVLRGSFRLPVNEADVVRPKPDDPELAAAWRDVEDPRATAMVPLTLVITGDDVAGPWVKPLRVPARVPLQKQKDQLLAAGYFSVDLLHGAGAPGLRQSYAIWAVHGEVVSGPVRMALIPPEALPDGR